MKFISRIRSHFNRHCFMEESDVLIVKRRGKEFRCTKCGLTHYTTNLDESPETFNTRGCAGSLSDYSENMNETFNGTRNDLYYHFFNTTRALLIDDWYDYTSFMNGMRKYLGKDIREVKIPSISYKRSHFPNILIYDNGRVKFVPIRKGIPEGLLFRDVDNNVYFQKSDLAEIFPFREEYYFYIVDRKWNVYIVKGDVPSYFDVGNLIREKVLSAGHFSCRSDQRFYRDLIKFNFQGVIKSITPISNNMTMLKRFRNVINQSQFKYVSYKFIEERFIDGR